ncbi:MAG: 30S ribosomal protein S16 [Alphaproteobacteria bacterium]
MSVSLRLSRGGSKKRPFFRIVAADIRAPRDGRYIERLGTYNPMREKDDPERVNLNLERIKYWLSVGAKPTERVTGFLAKEGLLKKPEIPKQTKQDKPKKKTLEKLKAKEEKLKAKEEMEKAVENVPDAQDQEAKSEAKPAEAATPPAEEAKSEAKPAEAATPPAEDKPAEDKPAEDAKSEEKKTDG